MKSTIKQPDLPKEWLDLVQEAMKSNVTKDEFRGFLQKAKEKRENKKSLETNFLVSDI